MKTMQRLLHIASQHDIAMDWRPMQRAESLSLPLPDGSYGVAIDPGKLRSDAEEFCKAAHEIGHCMTGAFYNRYSSFDLREKQEHRADRWAIEELIPVEELDLAIAEGKTELWMLADHFGVTEEFMQKAVCYYTHGNLDVEHYMKY